MSGETWSAVMEGLYGRGVKLFAAERKRQIEVKGFTPEHDQHHIKNELFDAARCYLWAAHWVMIFGRPCSYGDLNAYWPWEPKDWKPTPDVQGNIVKAGALLAAFIDSQEEE